METQSQQRARFGRQLDHALIEIVLLVIEFVLMIAIG